MDKQTLLLDLDELEVILEGLLSINTPSMSIDKHRAIIRVVSIINNRLDIIDNISVSNISNDIVSLK